MDWYSLNQKYDKKTKAIYDIGTEILIPELNMCLPYKNDTFFKKSGRFPDSHNETYAAKASERDLKASATFFQKFACGLGFAGAEKVNFST